MNYIVYRKFDNTEAVLLFNHMRISDMLDNMGTPVDLISAGRVFIRCALHTPVDNANTVNLSLPYIEITCHDSVTDPEYTSRGNLDEILILNSL